MKTILPSLLKYVLDSGEQFLFEKVGNFLFGIISDFFLNSSLCNIIVKHPVSNRQRAKRENKYVFVI